MERGIYFDGWHRNNHCYHPSLPMRNMQMVEDLEKYKASILVWSVLGGGSISLPYLEQEAFGEIEPRLRFYGFMNDSEFIAECQKRGIKPMGIVFEVQGWEFPIVVSEDGKFIKEINVMRNGNAEEWDGEYYGLNEFAQDKYPDLFKTSLKDYYPDGIVNSDGQKVLDLQEEVAARTWTGEAVHAQWVEVKGHSKTCYQTCRNNPVWRNYLKKIMQIQIDAGVSGIQLDEAELPITSMGAGGCYCKDCVKQFRQYLLEKKQAGTLSELYDGIDLKTFDYGQYLHESGVEHPNESPMYRDYYEFQMRAVKKHFTELVDFARDYARKTQGREILLSGNFFNCMPVYYPFENTVDIVITEMEHTLFRQPHWYRYINGFSGDKQVIVAENPYGGIIPKLLEQLNHGKGYDLYKILQLEASVYGCNMSVPYGGWMGNTIKDAFYPPRDVTEQIQTFLMDNDSWFSKKSGAKILVPYSFPSYYWREVTRTGGANDMVEDDSILFYNSTDRDGENASRMPFWEAIKVLSDRQAIYDVCMFGDDELRKDTVASDDWSAYELIVLTECNYLTKNQAWELEKYANNGGKILIWGRTAENIPEWMEQIENNKNIVFCENPDNKKEAVAQFEKTFLELQKDISYVSVETEHLGNLIGVGTHKNQKNVSVQLLNYNYNETDDQVKVIRDVTVKINKEADVVKVDCIGLDGDIQGVKILSEKENIIVYFEELPIYSMIRIQYQ